MSVMLEWQGFELSPDDGHLGLGWDRALQGLNLGAVDAPGKTLPAAADAYFRADRAGDGSELEQGFSRSRARARWSPRAATSTCAAAPPCSSPTPPARARSAAT